MRKFFILSSQRSGTTWLGERLAGMFGRWKVSEETNIAWWEEISNKSFIDRKKLNHYCIEKPNFIEDKGYLDKMAILNAYEVFDTDKIIYKTEKFYDEVYNSLNDNEFVNIMYDQCNLNCILNYPIIHLIRRDTIAQASSNYVAQQTGFYHNNQYTRGKNLKIQKDIKLNYDSIVHEARRVNLHKEVYFDTLKKYHKNCLTIYYEDCLDKKYWINELNKKLENFMEDSIQNSEYETENKRTGKMFNIVNSDGSNWRCDRYSVAIGQCNLHNLPTNAESLSKIFRFTREEI